MCLQRQGNHFQENNIKLVISNLKHVGEQSLTVSISHAFDRSFIIPTHSVPAFFVWWKGVVVPRNHCGWPQLLTHGSIPAYSLQVASPPSTMISSSSPHPRTLTHSIDWRVWRVPLCFLGLMGSLEKTFTTLLSNTMSVLGWSSLSPANELEGMNSMYINVSVKADWPWEWVSGRVPMQIPHTPSINFTPKVGETPHLLILYPFISCLSRQDLAALHLSPLLLPLTAALLCLQLI